MAWIDTVAPDAASGELAALYARVVDPTNGRVDHIMTAHSLHPAGLAAHFELYRAVMRGTPALRTAEREWIALHVSRVNDCGY